MADDFTIDAVRQTHRTNATGALIDVMEVSFSTVPEGATGSVRVDLAAGWEAAAQTAIAQRVAEIRALYGA